MIDLFYSWSFGGIEGAEPPSQAIMCTHNGILFTKEKMSNATVIFQKMTVSCSKKKYEEMSKGEKFCYHKYFA